MATNFKESIFMNDKNKVVLTKEQLYRFLLMILNFFLKNKVIFFIGFYVKGLHDDLHLLFNPRL